jgi:alcohol dehydrogenase
MFAQQGWGRLTVHFEGNEVSAMSENTNLVCIKVGQKQVRMVEALVPEPGDGEIIVRTTLTSICGSDLHILDESPLNPAMVPRDMAGLPMGHEAVGVVHRVGPGVRRLAEGQRVISSCFTACGWCTQCLEGQLSACTGGGGLLFGCQSRYYRVPFADISAAPIPDDLSDEQVLFATDIMSTGLGAVERGEVGFGDSVAVFGQGPVGLCATAAARARGAGLVIVVEGIPDRATMARRLGANLVVAPGDDAVQAILQLTDGRGVDVAIEAVGMQATLGMATRVVRRGGTVSSVGVYGGLPGITLPAGVPSFYHRKVVFTLCPVGHDRLTRLMHLLRHSTFDLTPLITHRIALTATPAAYELFRGREGGVLKVAIAP